MNTSSSLPHQLRIAVDIGGTFTDGVATLSSNGLIWVGKTPTTPTDPGEAVSKLILNLLEQVGHSLNTDTPQLSEIVHGTTLITNTLIERKGTKTALVTTTGMGDILEIRREWRYDIYDLDIELPKALVDSDCHIEVKERLNSLGQVIESLTVEEIERVSTELKKMQVDSVAVSFLHSYMNDVHEKQMGKFLQKAFPGIAISLSSEVASEIKEYERTSTVVASAYVKPIVASYLEELEDRIQKIQKDVPLRVMVSSGGFTSAKAAAQTPILLLESGPAAGVLSALNTARQNGVQHVLAFDMGGTTAKACVAVDGQAPIAHFFECARVQRFKRGSGLPILIPSIELIEIGAGGGSIAYVNRLGLLNVGPESSGSVPGPVCYDQGGKNITVTDADLILGYLSADSFLGGEMKLNTHQAEVEMTQLADQLEVTMTDAAWGIYNMVNENMASAARIHIAENGYDPRDFSMVATGGAGPVHAVEVARNLRIPRVLIPIAAGAGSCLGMLAAPARADRAWSNPQLLANCDWALIEQTLTALKIDAEKELEMANAKNIHWQIGLEMRYYGQGADISIAIDWQSLSPDTGKLILNLFEEQYQKLYGRLVPNANPQIITWRLTGSEKVVGHHFEWGDNRTQPTTQELKTRSIYLPLKKAYGLANVYDRYSLKAGQCIHGPLILEERESTIVVPVASEVTILSDLTVSILIKEFE
jgi:N-methylhydantoinase A